MKVNGLSASEGGRQVNRSNTNGTFYVKYKNSIPNFGDVDTYCFCTFLVVDYFYWFIEFRDDFESTIATIFMCTWLSESKYKSFGLVVVWMTVLKSGGSCVCCVITGNSRPFGNRRKLARHFWPFRWAQYHVWLVFVDKNR